MNAWCSVAKSGFVDIFSSNREDTINFFFEDNLLRLIKYKDSIGVEHGIELTEI